MKKFFDENKVVIFGLIAASGMTIQQFANSGPVDYKVLGLSVLVAAIGFLAKNIRGQWATILGSLLPSLGIVLTSLQSHTAISWFQFIGSAAMAIGAVFAPPTKSLSYEQSPTILIAKQQANNIDASESKNPPVSK